ncbi:FAD-dependent oxidoreductase [Streptomyces beijiangensis]|uniref:FAD-dependent oxidoreductase n=1 Tax=Streptomyces beijiangensis TaxID=163361 RepID=UPI003611C0D7
MDDGQQFADPEEKYDVAIVGAHLASNLLAAVLARQGQRVLLVDSEADAGQPAGETTVPYTAEVFFTLARRFDIPEIAALGLTCDLPDRVRRSGGIKRSLSFLYHRPGKAQDPRQTVQFNVPGEHSEWHMYRPDVEQYVHEVARKYGTHVVRHRRKLLDVAPTGDGVSVTVDDGTTYRARYLVDSVGLDSPILARLGGPDPVARTRTRSRVLTTHLTGVQQFEDHVPLTNYPRASPWSAGTISHLFAGGWIQVAHFDNHPEAGTARCSVTASVDPDLFGDLPKDPEAAFRALIERFPDLRPTFESAVAVQPWVSDDLWQRTVTDTVGSRHFLFERSASRNDLFLSRDVTMAAELVYALAPVLMEAARTDDWSPRKFAPVAAFQDRLIEFNDALIAAAQVATRDFQLWNAFSRVWLLWSMLAALSLKSTRNQSLRSGDWTPTERLDQGAFWFKLPTGLPELLDHVCSLTEDVRAGKLSSGQAAGRIFRALEEAPFVPPLYGFADPPTATTTSRCASGYGCWPGPRRWRRRSSAR